MTTPEQHMTTTAAPAMTTVHMIGNAHLDPVWLWRWPAGAVEAISTCRAAADFMDDYDDFVFTRSDMWFYEQIERLDPDLFERVRRHVATGQWQVVGGWVVQADCNQPTAESFRRHMTMGKAYCREKFGVDVTVGYNVDSFGHNGMLPSFLADAGYDSYVFMRPSPSERPLPSPLFRWRAIDGAEVVAWCIPGAYGKVQEDLAEHIQTALDAADPTVGHVMCFYGVGNHGGGPTRKQIEWIRRNRTAVPGAELVFSHPRAFFEAVKQRGVSLPVVEGELHFHAVGCYTAVRAIKRDVRRAEHGLLAAETVARMYPAETPPETPSRLHEAWKTTLFNQFHDILPGSSIPSAYDDASDQLGAARATADEIVHGTLLKHLRHLPADPYQRIAVFNPSDSAFRGFVRHDPWRWWAPFEGRLIDEEGEEIPYQHLQQESHVAPRPWTLLWPAELGAAGHRVFRLAADMTSTPPATDLVTSENGVGNAIWQIEAGEGTTLLALRNTADATPLFEPAGLQVILQEDHTDTWSHGIDGFREPVAGAFTVDRIVLEEQGPLRAAIRVDASFETSRIALWARLYANRPDIEIDLWIHWAQRLQVAKLVLPFAAGVRQRTDGIPGNGIDRPQNGVEYAVIDWARVEQNDGGPIGILCPNAYGLDGTDNAVRFTLLRSPVHAWHDPVQLDDTSFYRWTDRGEHMFRFRIVPDAPADNTLRDLALQEHRPPLCYDWTKGMQG